MKRNNRGYLHDLERFVGLVIIVCVCIVALIVVIYGLLGYFETSLRVVATIMFFCIVAAFLLGLQIGKAQVRGIEHGLDLKLDARARAASPAKPVTVVERPTARMSYDELIPPPASQRATIVMRHDDSDSPLEM